MYCFNIPPSTEINGHDEKSPPTKQIALKFYESAKIYVNRQKN